MRCVINLTGKTDTSIVADLPKEWFDNDNCFGLLYNYVCDNFPTNDWEDIVCKNIAYEDDAIFVTIATY